MARTVPLNSVPKTHHRWRLVEAFRIAILVCALLVAMLASVSAQAQSITIDPASAREAAASSITLNHTVGNGSNRLLIVSVALERDDDRVVSVTYAGQAMTFVGTSVDPNQTSRLEVWSMVAPSTGTNVVSVTLNGSAAVVVGAISFANVDQTNPISAFQFVSGTGASDAWASIASAPDQVVLASIAANDNVNSVTPAVGQTSRWNVLNAADVIGAGSTSAGSAITTMRFTLQSPQPWTMGVFSIRPSPPLGIVTNTNDSGSGSLRAAIDWANTDVSANTIVFNIPGAGPHTITLASALPVLSGNGDSIDGTTQPGAQCRDLWPGNGHDLRINVRGNSGFDGFRAGGANQTIRGLSISGFNNAIVTQATSSNTAIQCNYLGLLANGSNNNNVGRGVEVFGASVRIGGLNAGEGNVISSNNIAGIVTTSGSTDTAIRGNFIGTDGSGMNARPNGTAINHYFGAATWRDITHNLISGNNAGIALEADDQLSPSTDQIRVQRNRIGFDRTLSAPLLNGTNAAAIQFAPGSITNVLIGGDALTEGNEIAGSRDGIVLQQISNIRIKGNTIARSGMRGIWVENSTNVAIGGNGGNEGNVIGGNGSDGIRVLANSSGITILGNRIQPLLITGGTFANGEHGIAIDGANTVAIGDGTAGGRNLIAGNRGRGIQGSGANAAITIHGNYIGTDATGNAAVANGQNEIASRKDAIVFDSGSSSNISILNNVLGGYTGALIEFFNTSVNGLLIQGNTIGVGADGTSQIVFANSEDLIYLGGDPRAFTNVLIGGNVAGQGNTIAFSSRSGIRLHSSGTDIRVIGNTIRNNTRNGIYLVGSTRAALVSNRIFGNGLIGIDLDENGVTLNDTGDGDTGANDLLNFPQLELVRALDSNQLQYKFTLDTQAAPNGYRIEFFSSNTADPSGYGEGERYLGYVDITHAGGTQIFTGTLTTLEPVSISDIITTTATRRTADGGGDITSEFSAFATAEGLAQLTATIDTEVFDPQPASRLATPDKEMLLTTTVSNIGNGSTDADSIFLAIAIDPNLAFVNDTLPGFDDVIGFSTSAPTLTFTPGTDLRFSNGSTRPSSLAQCTYAPTSGYDSQVRYVCLNPKGSLPSGTDNGQIHVQLRARIN